MSSSNQGATAMDVDSPAGTTLKRCSSAPMINENNTGMTTSPPATTSTRESGGLIFGLSNPPRTRRFSASCSPLTGSPVSAGLRLTPRINQLRQEECADLSNSRELAHEREIHHTMQISQSWEDLRLVTETHKPNNKMAPLHVALPPYGNIHCNSPSPTRLSSPGFQSPTRGSRTFIRRSASPVLRPSPLGAAKRKLEDDKNDYHHLSPRAKRTSNCNPSERGGLLTTSSPLPGSLSSIGTPESISSADSPGFQFRMMDSPSPSRPPTEPMVVSKQDQEMTEEGPS